MYKIKYMLHYCVNYTNKLVNKFEMQKNRKEPDFPGCLWIMGNNFVNNVEFLAQTDPVPSQDISISPGPTWINFVLHALFCVFFHH